MARDGLRFFKANEFLWNQNATLAAENQRLRSELELLRRQQADSDARIRKLEAQLQRTVAHNVVLGKRVADLTAQVKQKAVASFRFKANTPRKSRKKPGRPEGHEAAVRPMPARIDVHQELPLPVDRQGKVSCPHCKAQLSDVEHHDRLVEDLVPFKVVTTCYHTTSGWCPSCRKRVESRADDQPPAADLPHAQLGLNALATAAVMRVCYRLPLRQITRLLAQLPGLKISPAAIVKQLKRLSLWLEGQYHRRKRVLRTAGVVYADETAWRTDGKNGYLWTLTEPRHTLFHVDRSRGAKVITGLLGEGFAAGGGTLVSDFYAAYNRVGGSQQKCLIHLLRELREVVARRPELKSHEFFRKCRRLVRQMLKLKKRREQMGAEDYAGQVGLLERRLRKLASGRWTDADAARLAGRLSKHGEHLTTFLHRAEVEGTNNAAERALRPAVVMRKITGGSRSAGGARAWAILASVMRTAEQQGRDVVDTIKVLLKAEWAGKNITLLTDAL